MPFRKRLTSSPNTRTEGKRSKTASSNQGYKSFPSDLGAHYTLFSFKDYVFSSTSQPTQTFSGAIALPPPLQIVEKHNVDYNNKELGLIGGQLLNWMDKTGFAAGDANKRLKALDSSQGQDALWTAAKTAVSDMYDAATEGDWVSALSTAARAAGPEIFGVAANMAFGNAVNPHITAIFKGVQLNDHTFNWNLSPRSVPESYLLASIVQEFKRAALPNYSAEGGALSNSLLTFPKVVNIVHQGSANEKFMTQYKDCVIKSISADYTPNGPSFFAGTGAPTHINISLAIQEIQIHTAEDYLENEDQQVAAAFGTTAGVSPAARNAVIGAVGSHGA